MKFANTVELKNKANELLRGVMDGEPVIITYRGKPAASLTRLAEDDLEDFILEHSPRIKKLLAEAEKAKDSGEMISLEDYLKQTGESGG